MYQVKSCLEIGNPKDYFRLLYWVYCRPSRLRAYFIQDSGCQLGVQKYKRGLSFIKALRVSKYKNIFTILPITNFCASSFIYILLFLGMSYVDPESTDVNLGIHFLIGFLGILMGTTLGYLFFVVFWITFSISVNIVRGGVAGVAAGLSTSISSSVLMALAFSKSHSFWEAIGSTNISGTMSLMLTVGTALGAITGVSIGGILGIISGLLVGISASIAIGLSYQALNPDFTSLELSSALLFGIALGLAISGAMNAGMSLLRGVMLCVCVAFTTGIVFCVMSNWWVGSLIIFISTVFALRLPFYLVECLIILLEDLSVHPSIYDEVIVFPLPKLKLSLIQSLKRYSSYPSEHFLCSLSNPLTRHIARNALLEYLGQHSSPVKAFYEIISSSFYNCYIYPPVLNLDRFPVPIAKIVILSELSQQSINCCQDRTSQALERFICSLHKSETYQSVELEKFAKLVLDILQDNIASLSSRSLDYQNLAKYCDSRSVIVFLDFVAMLTEANCLREISDKSKPFFGVLNDDLIYYSNFLADFKNYLEYILSIKDSIENIEHYLNSSSRSSRQSALLRANQCLSTLEEYLTSESLSIEKKLLEKATHHLIHLVTEAGGEISQLVIQEAIVNPYMAHNPVTGNLFVGRQDVFKKLNELLVLSKHRSSVVMYGHRRMGKTSILRNLTGKIQANLTLVNFDMQLFGHVRNTGELIYNLYSAIYDSMPLYLQEETADPDTVIFDSKNSYSVLNRFWSRVNRCRNDEFFVIAIDEFEILEILIESGTVDARFIDYLRGVFQLYPWIVIIMAGLHNIYEMSHEYWNPLFRSVAIVPIRFLSPHAARHLIESPDADFEVEYHKDAVDEIINLTNGQPHLIQLICYELISNLNDRILQGGSLVEKRIEIDRVREVIESRSFTENSSSYFSGIFNQVKGSHDNVRILHLLAEREMTDIEISNALEKDILSVLDILQNLQARDILVKRDRHYGYCVKLMQQWFKNTQRQD